MMNHFMLQQKCRVDVRASTAPRALSCTSLSMHDPVKHLTFVLLGLRASALDLQSPAGSHCLATEEAQNGVRFGRHHPRGRFSRARWRWPIEMNQNRFNPVSALPSHAVRRAENPLQRALDACQPIHKVHHGCAPSSGGRWGNYFPWTAFLNN